jgi:hypothetical protein
MNRQMDPSFDASIRYSSQSSSPRKVLVRRHCDQRSIEVTGQNKHGDYPHVVLYRERDGEGG